MTSQKINVNTDYDLICVGGGIMSATLAVLAKLVQPKLNILILERLDNVALESSADWNNAGTGHSALCELNYSPELEDGSIDISKALHICKQFEISKQFWTYLIEHDVLKNPETYIQKTTHFSWEIGEEHAAKLEKRYKAM